MTGERAAGDACPAALLRWVHQPVLLFLASIVVCTALEYVASWVMEKLFHAVFWDYSNEPMNINGRVCLKYSFYWGFLGLALIYLIVPAFGWFIDKFPGRAVTSP